MTSDQATSDQATSDQATSDQARCLDLRLLVGRGDFGAQSRRDLAISRGHLLTPTSKIGACSLALRDGVVLGLLRLGGLCSGLGPLRGAARIRGMQGSMLWRKLAGFQDRVFGGGLSVLGSLVLVFVIFDGVES